MKITFDTNKMSVSDIQGVINVLSEAMESNVYAQDVNSVFEAFDALSPELYKTKSGKNILKRYIAEVKGNKSTKAFYSLSESVYRAEKGTDASFLLNEALAMTPTVEKYDDSKLRALLYEAVAIVGVEKAKTIIGESARPQEVDSALNYLMSEEKSLKNLTEYAYQFSIVTSYINEHAGSNVRVKHEKSTMELDEVVNTFNDSCKGMSKEDRALVSEITNATDKASVFAKYKQSCINTIDESIKINSNNVDCERLMEIRERISGKTFSENTLGADILNFIELTKLVKE